MEASDHDQVPFVFCVTTPSEAVSVTTSTPGSLQVPLFVIVVPSSPDTDSRFGATLGATLFTASVNVTEVAALSLSVAVIVTVPD